VVAEYKLEGCPEDVDRQEDLEGEDGRVFLGEHLEGCEGGDVES
jgi:hypothetical protein